jgi:hypothetical protein
MGGSPVDDDCRSQFGIDGLRLFDQVVHPVHRPSVELGSLHGNDEVVGGHHGCSQLHAVAAAGVYDQVVVSAGEVLHLARHRLPEHLHAGDGRQVVVLFPNLRPVSGASLLVRVDEQHVSVGGACARRGQIRSQRRFSRSAFFSSDEGHHDGLRAFGLM